jgi:hypothetical protein
VLGTRLAKERLAVRMITGERSGVLEGLGRAHEAHPGAGLPQAGVVDLAGGLEPGEQRAFLGRAHPQRHLADTRGRALRSVVSQPGLPGHACLLHTDEELPFDPQHTTAEAVLQGGPREVLHPPVKTRGHSDFISVKKHGLHEKLSIRQQTGPLLR